MPKSSIPGRGGNINMKGKKYKLLRCCCCVCFDFRDKVKEDRDLKEILETYSNYNN